MALPLTQTENKRITTILQDMQNENYSICLERPTLLEQYWQSKQGKGKHPYIQRAEALAYVYNHRVPRIYREELIVGNISSKRIAANYYSEGGSVHILEDLFQLEKRPTIPIHLSSPEKKKLLSMGLRHSKHAIATKALLRPGRISQFFEFFRAKRFFVTEEAGISHLVPDYNTLIYKGLIHAAKIARSKLEEETLDNDREAFYQSIILVVDGIKNMAENLANASEIKASKIQNPTRRRELLEIAEICRHVPYHPARSFREGLQSAWLIHVALNLEDFEQGISFGRLDRFLYPLYKQDLEKGLITEDKARELLACFCLKCGETIPLYSRRINKFFGGNAVGQGITLGGTDEEGNDTTNELSRLFMEAFSLVMTREPSLHARIHENTPDWFWDECARLIQKGSGRPSLFNDHTITEALVEAGIKKEHARDYAVIGCVEMGSQGRTYNSSDAGLFNLPLCLELALNRGKRFQGGTRIGTTTPPVESMQSFDDVLEAFRKQIEHGVAEMVDVITALEKTYRIHRPTPLNSILTEGCLEKGKDVTWGGALYDFTSVQGVGLADAGDSLYALKELVFTEKSLTLPQLVNILRANFKDHKTLQARLQNRFPKYGNNHREADHMVQIVADIYTETVNKHINTRGGQYIPGFYSMTCHQGFGEATGALPNGRPAGARFSNGISPSDGADGNGPTAVLNSAASLDNRHWVNCCALNFKFEKNTVLNKKGRETIAALIKTFFRLGGMQTQINVLDTKQLLEARENPQRYPGLLVRISGYCAYFHDLSPEVQDEIIERTTHCVN